MEHTNVFRQHIPDYIDVEERTEFNFSTTEELINHQFIMGVLNDFEEHELCKSRNCIMITNKLGDWWWVIGFVKFPEEVALPEWEGETKK